jgi:nucleoside-diphosphate-sugar epimerase
VRDAELTERLARDVDAVIHLAALLPPTSERDRDFTMSVNLEGTIKVVEAIRAAGRGAHLIFTSSVSTYGDTSAEEPPVGSGHPLRALDLYAESKIRCEEHISRQGDLAWTTLRIAGIAVPAFLEPPSVWPFEADQRVEFVNRDDVSLALANCVGNVSVRGKALNVAGGPTWQMLGRDYVDAHFDLYGVERTEARYQTRVGWLDWYDTAESEALLGYQRTSFPDYCHLLARAIEEALA